MLSLPRPDFNLWWELKSCFKPLQVEATRAQFEEFKVLTVGHSQPLWSKCPLRK